MPSPATRGLGVLQLLDRPHLDDADPPGREARGQRARLVHVPGVDQEEAAQLLLRLREGPVGHRDLAAPDPDGPRGAGALERIGRDVVAAPADLVVVLERRVHQALHLLRRHVVQHLLVVVDQEQELHVILLAAGRSSLIGRTSMLPRRASGIRDAAWMASFRSRASITRKPSSCSLVSANGPSVVVSVPCRTRIVVAVSTGASAWATTSCPLRRNASSYARDSSVQAWASLSDIAAISDSTRKTR